jgi:hypothetical protein
MLCRALPSCLLLVVCCPPLALANDPTPAIHWFTDYAQAIQQAKAEKKLLFIFFYNTGKDRARDTFERDVLGGKIVAEAAGRFVWAKLPVDAQCTSDGKKLRLLEHRAFYHMHGRQGVAIIDYANTGTKHYGYVVSSFPFTPGKYYRADVVKIILGLPPGTITQRTMVFAVRMHPERPRSTTGQPHHVLLEEAESHSAHQASIQLQGHHAWDSRFHRINARLNGQITAQEVVAESWGGETLVDACMECVNNWRQSSGHWDAVRSSHACFGYDIKRGRNGVWYATGIFGRRRW